jgi:hypothetical protein
MWRMIQRALRAWLDAFTDVFDPLPVPRYKTWKRSDSEALASDWQAIGDDLRHAMERAEQDLRAQKEPDGP